MDLHTTPNDELITNTAQLREWLAQLPEHRPDGEGCSCGWEPTPGRTWEDHNEHDDINALHRVLVAATSDAGSVSECEEWLYACLDARSDEIDSIYERANIMLAEARQGS